MRNLQSLAQRQQNVVQVKERQQEVIPKQSFINQVHYYEAENLMALIMIDKEVKFYRVNKEEETVSHKYIPEMRYKAKFVVRELWIERHKVTRLLIACLAGEH
jgi:hypothetical protein